MTCTQHFLRLEVLQCIAKNPQYAKNIGIEVCCLDDSSEKDVPSESKRKAAHKPLKKTE
ncbi:MAG: hypothetical protein HUJ55_04540 [Ileibacterium sp.]|nr:hypothetical protein [Ileibacterium sp.]